MNRTLTQAIIISFIALLITATALQAQVTIGSGEKPVAGALLDLKQNANGQSSKGLSMPRVELTDINKLFPMFETVPGSGVANSDYNTSAKKTAQDQRHIGLLVFHNNKCTHKGRGLYVWDGEEWQPLHKTNTFVPTLSKTYFDLPSGHDARALTAQDLIVTWQGGTSATWATAANGGLNAVPLTSPAATGIVGASPYTMSILPQAMNTTTEVTATSPWYSKETKLTFTNLATDCGQQDHIILNQTNYALMVNGQQTNSQIFYTGAAMNSFSVQGNAAWTTTKSDPDNLITTTTPAIGTQRGQDLKDNTVPPKTSFQYHIALTGTRYDNSAVTFKDTAAIKRFNDITVSFINCNASSITITMLQWAKRAGFSAAQQTAIQGLANGGTLGGDATPVTLPNGVQAHKDQNGNIFLSGDFGATAGRWMLNNLAATSYATGARTGADVNISVNLPATPTIFNDFKNPVWAYPFTDGGSGTSSMIYDINPRVGLLYNWAAASNSKGSTFDSGANDASYPDGKKTFYEAEMPPATDPQTSRRQGICPNGWHLPSDYEWTQLEQEINAHSSKYSTIADANGTITVGQDGWRGTTHGQAMKDVCFAPRIVHLGARIAASNIISATTAKPGFNVMLVGNAVNTSCMFFGRYAYFWTASGSDDYTHHRYVEIDSAQIGRGKTFRHILYSVRCKKDD
ncbi:FISUMP domain-containing protein [Dysgonomonas sp. 25]|uniref:FISUMP domain-containing protein n=1 Tax=Dysgonomonas sp. 25 TaxID=2302933 RepID=UPI0013D701A4|nr:FISUMP domain-containing protein [Dysgonomonas sp. 25]NDV70429.1 hypothetical protein [Dysgonomonas sp. 25]